VINLRARGTRLRPAKWSVRTRLAAVSTVAVSIGLGVAGCVAYLVTSQVLHTQIDESLRGAPTNIGKNAPEGGPDPRPLCEAITGAEAPSPGLFTVQLIQADGTVCADTDSPTVILKPSDFETSGGAGSTRLRDGVFDNGHAARVALVVQNDEVLVFARDIQPVENVLRVLQLTLAGVTLLGALLALALSRWMAGAGLRPITQFTQVAEDIAETGSLDQSVIARAPAVAGRPGDELARLARAFNTMTRVLADAQMRQQRLVADAGHELRTPLSSLRANIALLRRSRLLGRALPAGEEDRLLSDVTDQVGELGRLVDDLAALAVADGGPPELRETRLDECVEHALRRARSRTAPQTFHVSLSPWTVMGDAASLERAALNLLDNAVKFSPAGSPIEVTLHKGLLTVADRGVGIGEEDASRAFERFWRSSGARALPGSGLGLSIVAETALQHGGWATLTGRPEGGTIAKFYVPEADTAKED
jgi:two-component system, OmpR family, sensor histidine kinase MprB